MEVNEKRTLQQVRNFEKAIQEYSYGEPLARFLTKYFKENRQMGASDRRMTSRLCYNFFRIGDLFREKPLMERAVLAEYLCETDSAIVRYYSPELNQTIHLSVEDKLSHIQADKRLLFPLTTELSTGVEMDVFLKQQLIQPDLFIRIRRNQERLVKSKLETAEIPFKELTDQTVALPNGSKLQDIKSIGGLYEVQDLSSQQTIDYIQVLGGEVWWDACAASGGKSLMLLDKYPGTKLLVSDIRLSILRNLDERFAAAGIQTPYRKKVVDLSQTDVQNLEGEQFDGIILDVPCSGSGTWGRTPEMKVNFSKEQLTDFAILQRKIATNALPFLKSGKALTYITCSVYKAENEDVVNYLLTNYDLTLDRMQILDGYNKQADTMFVARLVKN